ncbi:MAG: outer membrane protein assembly factor BamD, partial [bacterium]
NSGMDALEEGSFGAAINTFEELERQHPYSGWATRAQMMVVFAYYSRESYDEAVVSANRFIGAHPGHKDLPYMLYLKGMSFYNRISDVRRDQEFTEQALKAFVELTERYGDSEYARDAKLKITLCYDHLAGKEMMIGRYYQRNKHYIAAINRFRSVIEQYQRTSQTPEALFRLTETYLTLGIEDEATQSAAVLGHNFPNTSWYAMAYDLMGDHNLKVPTDIDKKSWFGMIWKGVRESINEQNN